MEEVSRRDVGSRLMAAAALGTMAAAGPARAAPGPDSLDGLAKAKGFTGFGSSMGGGAEDFEHAPAQDDGVAFARDGGLEDGHGEAVTQGIAVLVGEQVVAGLDHLFEDLGDYAASLSHQIQFSVRLQRNHGYEPYANQRSSARPRRARRKHGP